MLYVLLNLVGIEAGGLASIFLKRFISEKQVHSLLIIANLCMVAVGLQGAIATQNSMLMILSCVLGSVLGVASDLDGKFQSFGGFLQSRFKSSSENFSKGFITVFMIQAVGSMAIIGPLNVGLQGDPSILLFKCVLDTSSTLIYGAIYGPSVMLSGPLVFLYEAAIFLLAGVIAPFLTPEMTNEISAIGSLLIFAISLDLLDVVKVKVANYLPALLGPVLYYSLISLV